MGSDHVLTRPASWPLPADRDMSLRNLATRIALALCVVGCASNRASLGFPGVFIRTLRDTVSLEVTPTATSFRTSALITNVGSLIIAVNACGPEAQRQINSTWTTVFVPECNNAIFRSIPRGDSAFFPMLIIGETEPHRHLKLDPRMVAGRYRLAFGILTNLGRESSSGLVYSLPFIVRDSMQR